MSGSGSWSGALRRPALELCGVRCRLGGNDIIDGVDLAVQGGERLALIGPNGSGKSTLFHLIAGGLRPDAGEVRLHGAVISGLPAYRISRLGLARSFQISSLFPRLSVFENLRCGALHRLGYGPSLWHWMPRLRRANAPTEDLLQRIGLAHRRDTPAGHLSYAEQRTLEIGIALASEASVLLLDEPTAGMSRSDAQAFLGLIRALTQDRTVLIVEHDMDVVQALADRIAVLVQGRILALGSPDAVRRDPRVQQAYLGATGADAA
ncbi:MAG: ABC transporter ATP-binding protein [Rhodoferax sp.]|nr:ABC transporter ATP-binding protein [Rhodoferax sp.]